MNEDELRAEIDVLKSVIDTILDSGLINKNKNFWFKLAVGKKPQKKTAKQIIAEWPKWKRNLGKVKK